MSLRTSVFHPRTPAHLLHVIASQCAHWRGNPSSPQRDFASWYYLGRIRTHLRIRPKYCSFLRPAAGVTDCHVASLLAMTCRNLQRACVGKGAMTGQNLRRSTLASMSCRGKLAAAYKFAWEHVFVSAHTCPPSACHCEPVRLSGVAIRSPCRNLPRVCATKARCRAHQKTGLA